MEKKFLPWILIILIVIIVFNTHRPTSDKESLNNRSFSEFEMQYNEKKMQGYDVTEAEALARYANLVSNKGNYREADEFLKIAFEALERAKKISPTIPSTARTSLNENWLYDGPVYETHPYYYDGTFKGLTKQIPSVADMGVKTIYLLPIWEHEDKKPTTNYIYLINDYFKIDPVYGTEEDLKELVDTVHEYDMKIIFELVTCCASPESTSYNWTLRLPLSELKEKATKLGWDLQYTTTSKGDKIVYYDCEKDGMTKCSFMGIIIGDEVVANYYPVANFGPAIDRSKTEVIEYFTRAAEFYIREYNIDGWRLDVPNNDWNPVIISGDHSSLELLRSAKMAITNVKSDAIFVAEVPYLYPEDSAMDEIAEASYSFVFGEYVHHKILEGRGNSKEFVDMLENEKIKYNRARLRLVENHGTQRINKVAPKLNKPILVLTSTIPGIPTIQAGQEIGATNEWFYHGTAKPQVDWDNGDYELRTFYKNIFRLRNNSTALKYGTIENVWKSGDTTYAYLRSYENEKVIIIVNFLDKETTSILCLPFLKKGDLLHDELNDENFVVTDPDNFKTTLPACSSRILVREKNED